MTSKRIFNMCNITKNINSLSSPNPIYIYILQEWNYSWATVYVNYIHRLHGGPLFSAPPCRSLSVIVMFDCEQKILDREELKGEIMLLPVSVPLSLFQLECASLNNELAVRAQQIHDLYVQFCVNQHRELVKELDLFFSSAALKQEALLSHRGCAMLCVCQ